MIIGIGIGIGLIILITVILMLKSSKKKTAVEKTRPKVEPITKGRSYPWFYVKDCLYYFPVSTSVLYENETKQSLIEELAERQKSSNFEKVIELCDQIIAKDYKFSRAWVDKINAIYNTALSGKEFTAVMAKNVVNCCYNYARSFPNNYDKSVNVKHSLIPIILKRTEELIQYNREFASETYSLELYNMLINLYYIMPFNELMEFAQYYLESAKNLAELRQNSYGTDTIKSLSSHALMLKEKHKVINDKDTVDEVKVTNKTIINEETFPAAWIGFNILFPKNLGRTELMFKFYDQRRQEIDLSSGNNKRIIELFEESESENGYNVVVLGEDRIKYVTVEVCDDKKRRVSSNTEMPEEIEESASQEVEEEKEDKFRRQLEEIENRKLEREKTHDKVEVEKRIEREIKEVEVKIEEVEHKLEEVEKKMEEIEEEIEEEKFEEEKEEKYKNVQYKIYPNFSSVKQMAMSEHYCLLLMEDGNVRILGNTEKNIHNKDWENIEKVYVTPYTVYAIKKDNTITVAGRNIYDSWEYQYIWKDIKKLEPSYNHIVGLKIDGTVVAIGDNTHNQCDVGEWSNITDISVSFHTVGLDKEGNVFAVGANNFGECDVSNWTNIEKIAAGPFFTIGLRENGTVVATGLNSCGQCNTSDWKNVKEIYVKGNVTVGLKYDGTVLVAGRNSYRFEDAKKWKDIKDIKIVNDRIIGITSEGKINYIGKPYWGRAEYEWRNVVEIEANSTYLLGKKKDGSLVCNKALFGMYLPDNYSNFEDIQENFQADKVVVLGRDGKVDVHCINNIDLQKWDVSKFNHVKQIAMSNTHLIGLKHDGTVVVTGNDNSLSFEVEAWKNIVKVAVGEKFALGLTIDGRVVATGNNAYGQCDVGGWLDVVDIAVHGLRAIGLKSDGTMLASGFLEYGEEDIVKQAQNVVGMAINSKQIMTLDSNGNVSLSYNPFGEDGKNVLEWRNITKIVATENGFVGLKADKTLVTTGDENIEGWHNISDIKASGEYIVGIIKTK